MVEKTGFSNNLNMQSGICCNNLPKIMQDFDFWIPSSDLVL